MTSEEKCISVFLSKTTKATRKADTLCSLQDFHLLNGASCVAAQSQLESGMYQVKARAKTYVTSKKLLVAN